MHRWRRFRVLGRLERRRRRAERFAAVVVESAGRGAQTAAPVELRAGPAGRAEQSTGQTDRGYTFYK